MAKGDIRQVIKQSYSVRKFDSVDEALNFAIIREIDANTFYIKLAGIVKDTGLAKVLADLAAEELAHRKTLQAVKEGKCGLTDEAIKKIDFVEYVDDAPIESKMKYIDLLVIGIKKEETSRKLYSDLAAAAETDEIKDIFQQLEQQEARHRHRFEAEHEKLTSQSQ
ncbi:MAG: ferritin family protein [Phycisphaerae bacterium]|nr:ferritin family protein [Phycisphaerae bacterium]